jgi:molybdopterin-synthase adenylyltransferase
MSSARYSRQSFLGEHSDQIILDRMIGVVGVGGGGSHIVQQLAHVGFKKFILYDPDVIDVSNLNRTVNASEEDIEKNTQKLKIACRPINRVHTDAQIGTFDKRWQDNPEPLRECDIVFGCVDKYQDRHELEVSMRRYFIPYIDIGLTVVHHPPRAPLMSGHVFLSMPGKPCMWCLGVLSEGKLADEAQAYGDTGPRPQVVWANGVLASTAVGIALDLVTGWTQNSPDVVYMLYEGNCGVMRSHPRLNEIDLTRQCHHHQLKSVGDPIL